MDRPAHVADILTTHVLSAGIKDEALIAPYPGIASYRDRCLARPAWKRALQAYCARVEAGSLDSAEKGAPQNGMSSSMSSKPVADFCGAGLLGAGRAAGRSPALPAPRSLP
jgi:hypothetical protein